MGLSGNTEVDPKFLIELLRADGGIRPRTTRLVFGTEILTGTAVGAGPAGTAVGSGVVRFPVNGATGATVGIAAAGAAESPSLEHAARTAMTAIAATSNNILLPENKPVILPSKICVLLGYGSNSTLHT